MRTRSIRARIVAKAHWLCDGCGRWRPAGSSKFVITEEMEIVGQLCVFCCTREGASVSQWVEDEAVHAGGVEDPFWDESVAVGKVWEEVMGGVAESAESELEPESRRDFPKLSTPLL